MTEVVVSAEWLKQQLDAGNDRLVVLDATWYSAKDGRQDYLQKHIPGSVWFNIMEGVKNTDMFPRNIPDQETFQKYCRSLGIRQGSRIVIYDAVQAQCGFFLASRAWWLFRLFGHQDISVLNGGLNAWESLNYPTSTDVPQVEVGDFVATFTPSVIRTFDQMKQNLAEKQFGVCDTRPAEKYNGNPNDPRSGHYPGAASMTLASVLVDQETKRLKTLDELNGVFSTRSVDLSKPVVAMCSSGMSSCSAALCAYYCGAKDISVYLGGFTEWSKRADTGDIEQSK